MAKFTIEVELVADDSELRRERDDALAAVEEWIDNYNSQAGELADANADLTAARRVLADVDRDRNAAHEELAIARESLRLCRRELSEVDRKLRDANADRDRAIAERDEARKALADRGGVTLGIYANACRTRDEAFAELAALRARVAELEAERGWSLGVKKFVTANGTQYTVAEYVELMRARVAELEATAGTRDKRIIALCARINQIGALANCD